MGRKIDQKLHIFFDQVKVLVFYLRKRSFEDQARFNNKSIKDLELAIWHFLGTEIEIFRRFLAPEINQYISGPRNNQFHAISWPRNCTIIGSRTLKYGTISGWVEVSRGFEVNNEVLTKAFLC